MKARELMIGDWVTVVNAPTRVDSVGDSYINISHCYGEIDDYIEEYKLSPIPLTTEILEKNGFLDYGEIKEYHFEENGEKYRFYLRAMYNKDNVNDAWGTNIGGVLPSLIIYVHELQRALRLCGLNELADSLKV